MPDVSAVPMDTPATPAETKRARQNISFISLQSDKFHSILFQSELYVNSIEMARFHEIEKGALPSTLFSIL